MGKKWLPDKLSFLGVWSTPGLVAIHDERLGILSWLLKLGVLIYGLLMLFLEKSYNLESIPGGYPTAWFETGDMLSDQALPHAYCTNPEYNWNYTVEPGWWDEADISCVAPDYGDVVSIGSRDVMAYTYQKKTFGRHFPCANGTVSACSLAGLSGARESVDLVRTLEATGETVCSCSMQQDSFIMGVDKLRLVVQHAFTGDASTGYLEGSSTYTNSVVEDDDRLIKTCIKKQNPSDEVCKEVPLADAEEVWEKCCWWVFQPGKAMSLTVEQWLRVAGASLDERLPKSAGVDPFTELPPMRRVAGTKLHFQLRYYGQVANMLGHGDETMRCELTVENREGWTSAGSSVLHQNFQGYTNTQVADFYKRGVRVQFFAEGILYTFDWQNVINTLVSALVFLGVAETVVGLVAFYVLPEKDVYKRAQTQRLDHGQALAHFGIFAALACEAFKSWNRGKAGEKETLSQEEFAEVFETGGGFEKAVAQKFSSIVLRKAAADPKHGMACQELIEVLGGGLVSMKDMEEYADKMPDPGASSGSSSNVRANQVAAMEVEP